MLTLSLDGFALELDGGTVKHVGASNTAAAVTLYDPATVEARPFGDERVKLACVDEGDNEVEIAMRPEQARNLADALDRLASEGDLD